MARLGADACCEGGGGFAHLGVGGEVVGRETEPAAARVCNDAALLECRDERWRVRMLHGEEAAMLFIRSSGGDADFGEIALQAAKTVEIVVADAIDTEGERELLSGACLI